MQLPSRLGKYELQQFLGGGMSNVYRAFDTVIGRTVAVKILTDEGSKDQDTRERFLDEARTAARVTHENVIAIYDFGVDHEKGLFMVMEFLQGEDLRSAIKNGRTGDLRAKLKIALQAARALNFVHQQKVIHRDVKPENLHLNPAGLVKLMDFGIARSEDFSRTQPGFALGTPFYMAPEQVRGEKLTCQVDVYSFGILLFELLAGAKPFQAETLETIFYNVLNMPIDMAPLRAAGIPEAAIDVISRCTAKSPAERPQGLEPVIADLEQLIADTAPTAARAAREPEPAAPVEKSRRGILMAAAGIVLLAGGAAAYLKLHVTPATHTAELPKSISTPTGTMVLVPAGEFLVGREKERISLPAFYVDETEVPNSAYAQFCQSTGRSLPSGFPTGKPDLPVVNVTIQDARDFAKWAGKRLPTAFEWEKAARGAEGRMFPWGNEADAARANVGSNALVSVTGFRPGASPYGGLNFVGNVWEYVDKLRPPPSDTRAFQKLNPPPGPDEKWYMIRGQSAAEPLLKDVIWDSYAVPERWKDAFIGFRCAKDPP